MKLKTTTVLQAIAWIGAFLDFALKDSSPVPNEWKPWVALGAGAISLFLHQHSGVRNPDGTDARVAYEPAKK